VKRQKVIKRNQLPTYLPISGSISWFLLLDHFHAPSWVWGVWGTIWVIGWAICIWAMCAQEPVELTELASTENRQVEPK